MELETEKYLRQTSGRSHKRDNIAARLIFTDRKRDCSYTAYEY